jgi:DNA-directed RNA polymerase specialized sigma24 family protein
MAIDDGSITHLLGALKGPDAGEAARQLWDRYFDQLVLLARARLRARRTGPADEEDAALSAFDSLCRGVSAGRFPRLDDRDDLWRLLATITARKAADLAEREARRKRGGGRVLGESELGPDGAADGAGLARVAGPDPTPSFAVMVDEELRVLFSRLPDDTLRAVALLKMEGHTNGEIAGRLGCALRSVERKLERIRVIWAAEADR